MKLSNGYIVSALFSLLFCSLSLCATTITGSYDDPETLMQWHKITVTIDGPAASETGTPNPFLDYRMNVLFEHPETGVQYLVPGYYAADGQAADTSASSGNQWRAHFCPSQVGTWTYTVSFRWGTDIAVNPDSEAGSSMAPYDGLQGSFTVMATDKTGRDMRGKGLLEYVGGHFLRFAGNGEYFIKQGADAPENFLAYQDFDGPFKNDGQKDNLVKTWSAHIKDWQPGDPVWQTNKGQGILGAINYLASEGLNAFSFLTMNIKGDDRNVFPYLNYNERKRMDCSRLDQWEIVFEHADKMGMFLHFKTQETENELLLDNGDLGTERKLYYRELIARFSHHLALNWNLGEEINNASTAQKQAWAQYFYDNDPYHHHIVIHNGNNHFDLMGPSSKLTGMSVQTNKSDFSGVFNRVKDYINRSDAAGKPWAVACDEPGDASHALRPDDDAGNSHVDGRKNGLWGCFMAGGWGNEWYFGYKHAHSDLTCQDFRSRDQWWDACRYALQFFTASNQSFRKPVPVQNMSNADQRVDGAGNHCLFGDDDQGLPCLVVSTDDGGSFKLDVPASPFYKVGWMNAATGQWQYDNNIINHKGGDIHFTAPSTTDWILLVYDWVKFEDNAPPTPNPMTWKKVPTADPGTPRISMTATTATDLSGVEYYFDEISGQPGGTDSGWQSSPAYTDTDLLPNTTYTYTVKARDFSPQRLETGISTAESATTPNETITTLQFEPKDDAYLQGTSRQNNNLLRVEHNNRTAYLKFIITGLTDTVIQATLTLRCDSDAGNGNITLYTGTATGWTENNLSSGNAPHKVIKLDSIEGDFDTGTDYTWDVTGIITGNKTLNFILEIDSDSNDTAFSSKEGIQSPILEVTTEKSEQR